MPVAMLCLLRPRLAIAPILEIQARKVELLTFPLRNFAVLIYTSQFHL